MNATAIHAWQQLDLDAVASEAKAIAFDLDGTLARSKKPISPQIADCLTALTHRLPVAIVTGGRFALVRSQILDMLDDRACKANMHLMPTSGTRYYRWDGTQWECVYEHNLSVAERQAAISSRSGYFWLIGTSTSRKASFGACSETASATGHSSDRRSIAGTRPEVDTVTRRRESP